VHGPVPPVPPYHGRVVPPSTRRDRYSIARERYSTASRDRAQRPNLPQHENSYKCKHIRLDRTHIDSVVILQLVVCEMVQIATCSGRELARALQKSSRQASQNALKLSAVLAISGTRPIIVHTMIALRYETPMGNNLCSSGSSCSLDQTLCNSKVQPHVTNVCEYFTTMWRTIGIQQTFLFGALNPCQGSPFLHCYQISTSDIT
jgi:hypothetical protein